MEVKEPTLQWRIWDRLRRGPASCAQVWEDFGGSYESIQLNFRRLRKAGHIVAIEKIGRHVRYRHDEEPPKYGVDGRGSPPWTGKKRSAPRRFVGDIVGGYGSGGPIALEQVWKL